MNTKQIEPQEMAEILLRKIGGWFITNETTGLADIDCVTNLCTDNSELVIIVAVNFTCESQLIFQDHQRFVGDLADRQ